VRARNRDGVASSRVISAARWDDVVTHGNDLDGSRHRGECAEVICAAYRLDDSEGDSLEGDRHVRDPRKVVIPPSLWDRPEVRRAISVRDLGSVFLAVRKYTGLSQTEVGELLGGVAQSEVSNIERGRRRVAELDLFERAADGLRMPDQIRLRLGLAPARPQIERPSAGAVGGNTHANVALLAPLRAAMTSYLPVSPRGCRPSSEQASARAAEAHRRYQRADYEGAARLLPDVMSRANAHSCGSSEAGRPTALKCGAVAYIAASKLASKAGDCELAWIAADRAATCAAFADHAALSAAAAYQVACAFFGDRRFADAERVASVAADDLRRVPFADDPDSISALGSLLLIASIAAASEDREVDSQRYLADASVVADQLGHDDNRLWTAFGPTNVAIHRISAAVALGRPDRALGLGATIDTSALPPDLLGRRSQVHLDLAWACAEQGEDAFAVLHLLEAERVAAQALRINILARQLVLDLLGRERQAVTPGLRPLASRAGVLS